MPKKTSQKRVARKKPEKLSWFQRFGLFFYDKRETTLLFWVTLVIFGVICYSSLMKRQGFPNVDVPVSVVSGAYFVGDRQKVDTDVVSPASEVLMKMPEVDTVTSQAGDNFFAVIVRYNEGVTSSEGNNKARDALQKSGKIPERALIEFKPVDAAKFTEQSDLLVSVYSTQSLTPQQLEERAKTVTAELAKHEGVAKAAVIKQFEAGINPQTGQQVVQQRAFDRIGVRQGGEVKFYSSAVIGVTAKADTDAIHLSHDVQEALTSLSRDERFKDLKLEVSADLAEGIESQIESLQRSLLEGLAAVLLVSFLLISWRASLTSALSMITVLLLTIVVLYLTGNSLNTITLFALILSLGLIVDDTTIMVEAIDAAKRESRSKRAILASAMKRVARASTAGTLTTMLAFAPMLFVSGILGDFIRVLPITIIVSLAMSLLVSLALVPLLASGIILRKKPKASRNPVLKLESGISGGLAYLLRIGKHSRKLGTLIGVVAILSSFGLVAASTVYFQKLKFDIFPSTKDSNVLNVALQFAPETTIQQAQVVADEANTVIANTLDGNIRRVSYQNNGSAMTATATVDLISYEDREVRSPELIAQLEKAFEGYNKAVVKVNQLDAGPPKEDLPFRVQVFGDNAAQTGRVAQDIVAFLQGRQITRAQGSTAKVTRAELSAPVQVTRIDGNRMVEIRAGYDADDTSALVTTTKEVVEKEFTASRLRQYGLPEDALSFDFGSESDNQDSFRTMIVAFPVLLLVMYLLMSLQFKSFLQPLLIFLAIPFSFFGVAWGLHLTDNPLSFFVMVGFFALIGIAVNNTILLTDYANQARLQGMGRIDAIASAVKARFRPLLTTSLTSVVALIPLALSDPFWESLSFTLIFGLLSSTLLVVVAFPYIWLAGEVLRIFGHRLWVRALPKWLQYPLDVLIAPVRLVAFVLHIIFRWQPKLS